MSVRVRNHATMEVWVQARAANAATTTVAMKAVMKAVMARLAGLTVDGRVVSEAADNDPLNDLLVLSGIPTGDQK